MKNTALFYMNYTAPYPGNFLASMMMLVKSLQAKNIKSHFIFPVSVQNCSWVPELTGAGITVSFIPEGSKEKFRFFREVFRDKSILFLHLHFTDSMAERLLIKLAMLLCRNRRPIVVHYHNHYSYHANALKRAVKKASMHGDYLLGCSAGVAESLKNENLSNDIAFIENAIAFERLVSSRSGYGQRNFLQFGFDYERKGVDISLEAFKLLREKYDDLSLSISLSSNRKNVEDKITEKLGEIPAFIKLLPPTENIAAYYDEAAAFLSPSREEGFCYSAVEAAYCKCPVIASDISGQNGINVRGIIWCKSESPSDLADKIDGFLRLTEEEKSGLGSRLKEAALKHYDLSRWVTQIIAYYEERKLLN